MSKIIDEIRAELIANSDEQLQQSNQRFFKEYIHGYGMKNATVVRITKEYFKVIKDKPREEIFDLCEELWQSGMIEESFVACNWSYNICKKYTPDDLMVFEKWIDSYVNNWASCDGMCNHTVGKFVEMYPETISELKRWALLSNRWMKRASAVSLIVPARRGLFLKDIIEIADILLMDNDDIVQKGYGWMLKAASQAHQKEIFEYVMSKKTVMPRTALRYAIEKMPSELRAKAMDKSN
jgi:3-methyladenine DNA glycosylase AlkD